MTWKVARQLDRELRESDDDEFLSVFVNDREVAVDDIPYTLNGGATVTAYSEHYVFYTEFHDTHPNRIRRVPRDPDKYRTQNT